MSKTKKKNKAGTVLFAIFSIIVLAVCAFTGMTYAQCSFRAEEEPINKTAEFVRIADSELQSNQGLIDELISNGNISDVIRSWCTANNDKKYNMSNVCISMFVLTDAGTATTNYGNADCIILASTDSLKKTVSLIQIDRDTLTYSDTDGGVFCKLNTVYANGGCELLKQTIENTYKIVINRTFSVSVDEISAITDTVGGLNVNVPTDLANMIAEDYNVNLTIGNNDLNGAQMAYYLREKRDGRENRNARLSSVANALLQKVQAMNVMDKLTFAKALAKNCRSDVAELDTVKVLTDVFTIDGNTVSNYTFPLAENSAQYKDSDWILVIDMAKEAQSLQTVLFDASNVSLSAERQSSLDSVKAVNEAWSVEVSMSAEVSVSASMEATTEKPAEEENEEEKTTEEEGVVG